MAVLLCETRRYLRREEKVQLLYWSWLYYGANAIRKTSNFYGPLPGLATRASTGGLGRSAKAQAAGQLLLIAVFGVMFREPADIDCCCLLRCNIGVVQPFSIFCLYI